jgi:hypothetical protein
VSGQAPVREEPSEQEPRPDDVQESEQRFASSIYWSASEKENVFATILSHQWVFRAEHSLVSNWAVYSESPKGSGVGDVLIDYHYDPSARLSARPWIPRNLGFGIAVLLPAGNKERGTGLGEVVTIPSVGGGWQLSQSFGISGLVEYFHSFGDQRMRVLSAGIALVYVSESELWARFEPRWNYDMTARTSGIHGALDVGKMLNERFGLNARAEWGRNISTGGSPLTGTTDTALFVAFHYLITTGNRDDGCSGSR